MRLPDDVAVTTHRASQFATLFFLCHRLGLESQAEVTDC
jgi:hypothetical protein